MPARLIDGRQVAQDVLDEVKHAAASLRENGGPTPGIAVVIIGDDPASQVYVRNKAHTAKACGFHSVEHRLPAATSEEALRTLIVALNADPAIHGILVQLPLPKSIREAAIIQAIDRRKDVDGFHLENVGLLATGQADQALIPCTPNGCMRLLRSIGLDDLSGRSAVIVGRSNIVGKPMAQLLLAANATVTMAHSRTADLPALCRTADILVAAVGQPEMIRGDWVRPGTTVIDVGINRLPAGMDGKTRLVGDVAFAEAVGIAGAITPVPGGVGPMTIAMLMANTLTAAARSVGAPVPEF